MVFVDDLAFSMILLVLVAATVAYTVVVELYSYSRRGPAGLGETLRESAVPMIVVGIVALALGLWGEFTWPLPGSYNILFFDVYTLFGVMVLGFGLSVYFGFRLQFMGALSLMSGCIVIAYGASGYYLGMTSEPYAMFLLYGGWGLVAILAFPVAVISDRLTKMTAEAITVATIKLDEARSATGKTLTGKRSMYPIPTYWLVVGLVFALVLVLAMAATFAILGNTIWTHLQKAP